MKPKEIIRIVSIEFAHFLTTQCFYNIKGYMMYDQITVDKNQDNNEYEVDELYDYWIDNIYLKEIEPSKS